MSIINREMMKRLVGVECAFEMKGDLTHNLPDERIRFVHTITDDGWHGVQETAAAIIGKEFDFENVIHARSSGRSARIALEAHLDVDPGGYGYACAVQDEASECYSSIQFSNPKEPDEPDYEYKVKCAKRAFRMLQSVYDEADEAEAEAEVERCERAKRQNCLHDSSEDEDAVPGTPPSTQGSPKSPEYCPPSPSWASSLPLHS
jgi:hypothetical protein